MSVEGIKTMVRMRLTFNSMFSPLDNFILRLPQDKFDVLFDDAYEKLQARMNEFSKKGHSMGKRGCDLVMIKDMENLCVELHYDECKALLDKSKHEHTIKGLHADEVILDEYNYSEKIVVCPSCGCEENADEMRENMCPDCYEDYKEDFEEEEED